MEELGNIQGCICLESEKKLAYVYENCHAISACYGTCLSYCNRDCTGTVNLYDTIEKYYRSVA